MRTAKITAGGQISVPAAVRKRWGTRLLALDDQGDQLVLKPLPDDPIAAARGAFKHRIGSSSDLRAAARGDEDVAVSRRR